MAMTLKAARVNQNLNQVEAAKEIGVSVSTLQNWEKGKCCPSVKYIARITEVYRVTYDDLIFLPVNYA